MKAKCKIFLLLLTLIMVFSLSGVMGVFAEGTANVYLEVDKTEVSVGDTVTVTVYNNEVTAKGFGVLVYFDKELLTCTYLDGVDSDGYLGLYTPGKKAGTVNWVDFDIVDDIASTNTDGIFSAAVIGTEDKVYNEGIFVTMTFVAEAAGQVEFKVEEQTSGQDGFIGVAATQTLTILGKAEHTCAPGAVTYEKGTNGKHTKITACADPNCDKIYESVEESCSGGTATCTAKAECQYCNALYGNVADHTYNNGFRGDQLTAGDCCTAATYATKCDSCDYQDKTKVITGDKDTNNHVGEQTITYTNNGADHTVTVTCKCGVELSSEDESHTYDKDHKCVCNNVEEFILYFAVNSEVGYQFSVPYGKNLAEYLNDKRLAVPAENIVDKDDLRKGVETFKGWCTLDGQTWLTEDSVMPAQFLLVVPYYEFSGWSRDGSASNPWVYKIKDVTQKTGWTKIDDFWYYLDPKTGARAEGLARVPYPTEPINGITYEPNQEDLDYAASKGTTFKDATEAWFYFGEDGKFMSDFTGIMDGKYVQNGMAAWHPGFVQVDGVWYYFVGDKEYGGNKLAEGLIYVTRNAEAAGCKTGDQLYFVNGKVDTAKNGIVEEEGVKYCFVKGKRVYGMVDLGDGKYVYVRSNGVFAVDQYWVTNTNGLCNPGMYTFDENGYLVGTKNPGLNGLEGGVYYKNGMPYYAGLIKVGEDIYYVKSNGEVVKGTYYVTKTNGMEGFNAGDKLVFDENGKLLPSKNGIVEVEDGVYKYYVNNHVQYGAGVLELTDDAGKTYYIYVKSDGTLATGKYWPTTRNDLLESGEYDWGTDGKYYPEG